MKAKLIKAGRGDPEVFPRLQKAQSTLKPGGTFKAVTLLKGWLVVNGSTYCISHISTY